MVGIYEIINCPGISSGINRAEEIRWAISILMGEKNICDN